MEMLEKIKKDVEEQKLSKKDLCYAIKEEAEYLEEMGVNLEKIKFTSPDALLYRMNLLGFNGFNISA